MTNFSEKTQSILESFQRDRGETPAVSEEYNEVKALLKDVVRYKIMNEQSMPTAEQRRRGLLQQMQGMDLISPDPLGQVDFSRSNLPTIGGQTEAQYRAGLARERQRLRDVRQARLSPDPSSTLGQLQAAVDRAGLVAGVASLPAAAKAIARGLKQGGQRLAQGLDDLNLSPTVGGEVRLGSNLGNLGRGRGPLRSADVPDTAGSGGAPRPPRAEDFDDYADYVEAMNRFESARSTPSAPSPKPADVYGPTKPSPAPETTAPKPVDAPETTTPKPAETPETRVLSPGELRREIRRVSQDPEIRAQVQQETIQKAAAERAAAMDKPLGPTRVRTKEAIDTAVDNTLIAKQLWNATKGAYRYSRKHPIKSSAMLAAIGELGGSFPGMPGQPAYSSAYESLANLYRGNFPEAGEKAAEGAIRASWYLFPTLSGKLLQAGRLASELALGQKVKDAVAERLRQASERIPEGPGLGPALRDIDIRAAEAIDQATGGGTDQPPRGTDLTRQGALAEIERRRGQRR